MSRPTNFEALSPEEEAHLENIHESQLTNNPDDVEIKKKLFWKFIHENNAFLYNKQKSKVEKTKKKNVIEFISRLTGKESEEFETKKARIPESKIINIKDDKLIKPEVKTIITNFDF